MTKHMILIHGAWLSARSWEKAAMALKRLARLASGAATPWALGTLARGRALLADPATAEPQYQEAVHHLSQTGWRTGVARSHLVYGEWLRRRKRTNDARSELRTAHEMFQSMGAQGFAERARVELLATGERARSRRIDTSRALTPREEQIARLAAQRATSREIGAQLFISANTVDCHLRKIFQKLGASSRRQIASSLSLLDESVPVPDGEPAAGWLSERRPWQVTTHRNQHSEGDAGLGLRAPLGDHEASRSPTDCVSICRRGSARGEARSDTF